MEGGGCPCRGPQRGTVPGMKKLATSIRLPVASWKLRDHLSSVLGVTKSAVLILALRELAKRHGVAVER